MRGFGKKLPDEFTEAHLCYVLKMSYTQLKKQPYKWVESMLFYLEAKDEVSKIEQKKEELKNKVRHPSSHKRKLKP